MALLFLWLEIVGTLHSIHRLDSSVSGMFVNGGRLIPLLDNTYDQMRECSFSATRSVGLGSWTDGLNLKGRKLATRYFV